MSKIILKEGVIIAGLDRRMRPALIHGARIWKSFNQKLVITSGLEGEHSPGSLHYYGLAIDMRTRYFSDIEVSQVAAQLTKDLGDDFDVVITKTHIHCEYDPKIDPTHKELARLLVYVAECLDHETTMITAQTLELGTGEKKGE